MTTCDVSLSVSLVLPPIRIHVHMFIRMYVCMFMKLYLFLYTTNNDTLNFGVHLKKKTVLSGILVPLLCNCV